MTITQTTVGSQAARDDFPGLLDKVRQGEHVVITRNGKPRAALVPAAWLEGHLGAGSMSTDEAKRHLADHIDEVRFSGASIVITRYGKPVAVLVPYRWWLEATGEKDAR